MTNENKMGKLLSTKRVLVAVVIGVAIAIFLIVKSFNKPYFIKDTTNATHTWVDENGNGVVDFSIPKEFKLSVQGNYREASILELFAEIEFKTSTFLWILVAIIFVALRDVAYMLRIRLLTDKQLSWKRSFYVIMLWEFASALSPGVVGGSAVAMFILNRENITLGKSTALIIISLILDNLFFVLMIPFVLIFLSFSTLFSGDNQTLITLFWIGYIVICALTLLLFVGVFVSPTLILRFVKFILKIPFLRRFNKSLDKLGNDIMLTAKNMKQKPILYWLKLFGSTVLSWTARYLVINCLLHAFLGLGALAHIQVLGKQLVLWLLMLVSPTPGGSGVAEYAFTELLTPFTSIVILLPVLALIWRLISYFPYLFIGLSILPKWLKTTRK